MFHRISGWQRIIVATGLAASIGSSAAPAQDAERERVFRTVADVSGSQARLMAVGMVSLAKQRVESFDFDIVWTGFRDDSLDLIQEKSNDFGLIDLSQVDIAELKTNTDLRAVMAYWPEDPSKGQQSANTDAGYLLAAKASVEPQFVRELVAAVQADDIILKVAHIDVEKLDPSMAMVDLPLPLHQGAKDYLKSVDAEPVVAVSSSIAQVTPPRSAATEAADITPNLVPVATNPSMTPGSKIPLNTRSYIVYFDSNDAELDQGDMRSVAKACQFASKLPNAKFVISGHTDTVGSASANNQLAERRAERVAEAIRNDPRFQDALNIVEFGESKPAFTTGDEVAESLNRRVMITILPDQ